MIQVLQYMTISPLSILGSKGDKEKIYKQHRKSPANKTQKTSSQHVYELEKQSWKQIYGYGSTDFLKTQGGPGSLYPFWVLVLGCWEKGPIGTDKPPQPIFKFIQK